VDNDIDPLEPDTPLPEITRQMATYNLVALAVVDDRDRLVGAVTVDDLLDHLLPRDWRERDVPPAHLTGPPDDDRVVDGDDRAVDGG
jgi:CBS domain-containing protein